MKFKLLIIIVIIGIIGMNRTLHAESLVFSDSFDENTFEQNWNTGATGYQNTITLKEGRVQATANFNYIETINTFSGNLRIEMDIEKVGEDNNTCWDFYIELVSNNTFGILRFDDQAIDAINIGTGEIGTICGNRNSIDSSNVNKGKVTLILYESIIKFIFTNTDGVSITTNAMSVDSFEDTKIRIWLAAFPGAPRYIDNVKIYSLDHDNCETSYNQGVEAGRQACITDPSSCGISQVGKYSEADMLNMVNKLLEWDVNKDQKISLVEVIQALRDLTGIKN